MSNSTIGHWLSTKTTLPTFQYTGEIPYQHILPNGQAVKLPEDPWFILGNYQMTIFPHVSGEYELITGQRSWGRVNAGNTEDSGNNRATLINRPIGEKKQTFKLTGIDSLAINSSICKRTFGCGFAEYEYQIDSLKITRNMSVKPSTTPYNGASAFLLTVTIENTGKETNITYMEELTANYVEIQYQKIAENHRVMQYKYHPVQNFNLAYVEITKDIIDPLLVENEHKMSKYEGYPPSIFMQSISDTVEVNVDNKLLTATHSAYLPTGKTSTFQILIGFMWDTGICTLDNIRNELGNLSKPFTGQKSYFEEDWVNILPNFSKEKDEILKREMIWNTYVLEAMATYSNYYKETKVPQGIIYDYNWGTHASARDNFQHALPLVYSNPNLAKSTLRYMLKRTTLSGEIRLIEYGYGVSDHGSYFTSDQQLFFFLLLSEYLRVTKNHTFLQEEIEAYPADGNSKVKVLELVKSCFVFLRDTIGVGKHGIIRLLNSDWNDTIYYILKEPYNVVYHHGESHMNSAMGISILQTLIPELRASTSSIGKESGIENLCYSMELYREKILTAFLQELEGRNFPLRMYFAGKTYGEDNMFLEPQGYTLQINELSKERKELLYQEMQKRVYSGEKIGAREQENPEFEDPHYDKGSRENGGVWWALNGPIIIAMAKINPDEAWKLLYNMTFDNYAKQFPNYWTSYWSAADQLESSLIIEEGLPDQSADYARQPVFCAHPHAWPLYCYYYLNEENN